MRYSDHLYREILGIEMENDPKNKLDLNKWSPSEADTFMVSRFFLDWYKSVLDDVGQEEAQEYLDVYKKIKKDGILASKDDVQALLCEMFWAVDGEIEEYYKGDKDLLEIMSLTILKKPVSA